jgi:hypothetical protein
MQLFNVKDPKGQFIMNAPIETIRWVFKIPVETMVRVLNETQRLGSHSELHFRSPAAGKWPVLLVERLPLEIPDYDQPRAILQGGESHSGVGGNVIMLEPKETDHVL